MLVPKTPVRYLDYYGLEKDPRGNSIIVPTEHAERIADLLKAGVSVRLVAEAGVGKTTIMEEAKSRLHKDFDGKMVMPRIPFDALPETGAKRYIGRGGIAVIGRYIARELKLNHGGVPGRLSDDYRALFRSGRDVSTQEKSDHVHQMIERLKGSPLEKDIIIFFDDADDLVHIEDINNLNEFINNCHAVLFAMKPAVGSEIKDRDHIEEKVWGAKTKAFLRRTQEYEILGYPAHVLVTIVKEYVSSIRRRQSSFDHPLYPFSNEALSVGLGAAYTQKKGSGKENLYQPDRFLEFLSQCLQAGYQKKRALIDGETAKTAARRVGYGRSRKDSGVETYGRPEDFLGDVMNAVKGLPGAAAQA